MTTRRVDSPNRKVNKTDAPSLRFKDKKTTELCLKCSESTKSNRNHIPIVIN